MRGQVIDIFPAGEPCPARLDLADGKIVSIARYDPVTLRSADALEAVTLRPAIEFPLDPEEVEEAEALLEPDAETEDRPAELSLPRGLVPIFDYLPGAATYRDPEVAERWAAFRAAIDDAYAATGKASRVTGSAGTLPRPGRLYLTVAQAEQQAGPAIEPGGEAAGEELPAAAAPRRPAGRGPRRQRRPRGHRHPERRRARRRQPAQARRRRPTRAELGRHRARPGGRAAGRPHRRPARAGPPAAADRPAAAPPRQRHA